MIVGTACRMCTQSTLEKAVFNMEDGNVLAGALPSRKSRLVQAWIEIHREELLANWQLAVNGEEIFRIDPLR